MYKGKKVVCAIPARLNSTRFPRKVLRTLHGRSMLEWIFKAAIECDLFDEIIFAVDSSEVFKHVESFGGRAIMTDVRHPNATLRLIEVVQKREITADVWVNWQGDEPLIRKPIILDLLQSIDHEGQIWTLKRKISEKELLEDTNIVKVVCDVNDDAMYFSRHAIPFDTKDPFSPKHKHVGIYAYTQQALEKIHFLEKADCEIKESLEQLRFLYHGLKIKVHTTVHETFGVDVEEHLVLAKTKLEDLLKRQNAITV